MSAETLRRAASLMRERAGAAPPSPWATRATTHGDPANGPTHIVVENSLGLISDHDYDKWGGTSAEHIASWHPAVALAVADWLDAVAEAWPISEPDYGLSVRAEAVGHRQALAVARAYLGEPA